jgi:hypothetical protein
MCVAFATDAEKAAALIPKELQLVKLPLPGQSAANLIFAKYRECSLGPYMEVIISIPVLHNGNVYGFITGIYVDNDAARQATGLRHPDGGAAPRPRYRLGPERRGRR